LSNTSGRIIAAFDLDGTLTSKDTFIEFIRYVHGDGKFLAGMTRLSPRLLAFKIGLASNEGAKTAVLRHFFGGMNAADLDQLGAAFGREVLPRYLRPAGLERLRWHIQSGHECWLVTASLSVWTRSWAEEQGLRLIATEPEIQAGVFTGNLMGKNNHGPEKVRRLLARLGDEPIDRRYAYGDSGGDKELLQWADEPAFRPFR
jgi:phosphatidylglycerophosphatase C